jgi:hypothetical protein
MRIFADCRYSVILLMALRLLLLALRFEAINGFRDRESKAHRHIVR